MPNEPTPPAQNTTDELDEILVKEPDGTFRVVKVAPTTKQGVVPGQASSKPTAQALPRVEKLAPSTMVLGNEEEKELAAVTEKTKTIAPQMDDKSADIARRAIAESGVVLADPSLASRLLAALIAAVKEVRKELETRDLLMRPKEQGGLGMTMNEAMRLLSLLKTGGKPLPSALPTPSTLKPTTPLPPQSAPRQNTATPNLGKQEKPVVPPSPLPASKPVVLPPPPVTPKLTPPPAPVIPKAPSPLPPPLPPIPKPSTPRPTPPAQEVTRPPTETKPVVQDVTFTPRLVGPVDELQMQLAEWRRMAPTLKDRGTKIEEKLRLLEEASYADRLKGVAAWYASDVVRLYQDVGRESLASGKSVATILHDRGAKGLPTLTLEEFQSIAELNEKLRF